MTKIEALIENGRYPKVSVGGHELNLNRLREDRVARAGKILFKVDRGRNGNLECRKFIVHDGWTEYVGTTTFIGRRSSW